MQVALSSLSTDLLTCYTRSELFRVYTRLDQHDLREILCSLPYQRVGFLEVHRRADYEALDSNYISIVNDHCLDPFE